MLKPPWLIQRCELGGGKLGYDYMGSTEFEIGDQARSLKRIFAAGIVLGSVSVKVGEKEVSVYMVASKGFSFADYQPYLQQLADHKLLLKEWTSFDDVVRAKAGLQINHRCASRINAWFDFQNNVLWALTEDNQKALAAVLEEIKKKWSSEKK